MFNYVPEMFQGDHAETIEEADQWVEEVVSGKLATVRRPPELLARRREGEQVSGTVEPQEPTSRDHAPHHGTCAAPSAMEENT